MKLDEIIERDGAGCMWCGCDVWRQDMTVDHPL